MKIITKNKRAYFDYEITDKREAGIVLKGYEAKSIRESKPDLSDAVALESNGELRIHNMNIPLYSKASAEIGNNYHSKQKRKLLVSKKERTKIVERTNKTGQKILILKAYRSHTRFVKIQLGIGKRKKKAEKRATIRNRDQERSLQKELKKYR